MGNQESGAAGRRPEDPVDALLDLGVGEVFKAWKAAVGSRSADGSPKHAKPEAEAADPSTPGPSTWEEASSPTRTDPAIDKEDPLDAVPDLPARATQSCPALDGGSRSASQSPSRKSAGASEDPKDVLNDLATRCPSMEDDPMARIQFPATRGQSLESLGEDRAFIQWPATRGPSLEEDPSAYMTQWPATRGPSLDDDYGKSLQLWPATRGPSLDEDLGKSGFQWPATRGPSLDETMTPTTPWPATRGPSLDECFQGNSYAVWQSNPYFCFQGMPPFTDQSTIPAFPLKLPESTESSASGAAPVDQSSSKLPTQGDQTTASSLTISLTSSLGILSEGSAEHEKGTCKPCAFLWKDPRGCLHGQNCKFCHLCPATEIKQRKKAKFAMRKMLKLQNQAVASQFQGNGYSWH